MLYIALKGEPKPQKIENQTQVYMDSHGLLHVKVMGGIEWVFNMDFVKWYKVL